MKIADNIELLRNKGAFLLFMQLILFNVLLFYFCCAIFPIDFSALSALCFGLDTGMIWVLLNVFFVTWIVKAGNKAGNIVYYRMPAIMFLVFSLLTIGFKSMGLWFFGVLLMVFSWIWFLQVMFVSRLPHLTVLFFFLNCSVTLVAYMDYIHYFLTREHLNIVYLRILKAFNMTIMNALASAGVTPSMYYTPIIIISLIFVLAYPALRHGVELRLPCKPLYSISLFFLFIPLYFQFHLIASDITLSDYMNFKLRNFSFPLPNLPAFSGIQKELAKNKPDEIELSESDFARQADFKWLDNQSRKHVVIIVLESLRQDFLMHYMPKMAAHANEGIQCLNHYSNANDTEGAMLALYYGILPLVFQRMEYDGKSSKWLDFMQSSGYEFVRFSDTNGNLFYPEYKYTNFWKYLQEKGISFPEKTTLEDGAVLQLNAAIHKLKNSKKKCLVEVYLFHTHYPYRYPKRMNIYNPVLEDNSEILTLSFPDLTEKMVNRYRNALLYTDELLCSFIDQLKAEGLFDNTILVIIGDHGEMLGENGKLFHANGGEELQYRTPLIILGGDVPTFKVSKLTSHIDIVPTLGRLLGFGANNAYGSDVMRDSGNGVVTFDLAGQYRMIYRDEFAASLFHFSGNLSWILTTGRDFYIDENFETLYGPEKLPSTLETAGLHYKKLLGIVSGKSAK